MDWSVCSRECDRDYTWDNTHASRWLAEAAPGCFAAAFEGTLTAGRFAVLFRCPGQPGGVVLGLSVSTARRDAVGRPIRTVAFLRAETETETALLAAFFAECLRRPDGETLYDAGSPFAKAVEDIYHAGNLSEFTRFCQMLPPMAGHADWRGGPSAIPRGDMEKRRLRAEALSMLLEDERPFLAALADREPSAILEALGMHFARDRVSIFAKTVAVAGDLPEPGRPKRALLGGGIGFIAGFCVLFSVFIYAGFVAQKGGGRGMKYTSSQEDTDGNVEKREADNATPTLLLRRRNADGRNEWQFFPTTAGDGRAADGANERRTKWPQELHARFRIRDARFASDGRHLWLVCDPQTHTFFRVCALDIHDMVLRVLADGDSVEETPDGIFFVKNRKKHLYGDNGEPLGAAWYDAWLTPDGRVVRETTPTQNQE